MNNMNKYIKTKNKQYKQKHLPEKAITSNISAPVKQYSFVHLNQFLSFFKSFQRYKKCLN